MWIGRGLELGVGVNDIGTQLAWKVRRSTAYNDSVSGGYVQQTLAQQASFTSRVPPTTTMLPSATLSNGRFRDAQ